MKKLVVFVPETHLEAVKTALFDAGAGRLGDYEHCAWQTLGQGQFRPGADANPYLGKAGALEQVSEYRVEMVCDDSCLTDAVVALRQAHPYEEPAFDIIELIDFERYRRV
jgi:hypothetical protein